MLRTFYQAAQCESGVKFSTRHQGFSGPTVTPGIYLLHVLSRSEIAAIRNRLDLHIPLTVSCRHPVMDQRRAIETANYGSRRTRHWGSTRSGGQIPYEVNLCDCRGRHPRLIFEVRTTAHCEEDCGRLTLRIVGATLAFLWNPSVHTGH